MTEKQQNQLKGKIISEMERLKTDLEQMQALATEPEVEDSDEVTRMEALMAKRFSEATLLTMQKRYAALEYALKRMQEGEFGICMECGESIGVARLMAMPETTLCIDCAS